MLHQIITKTLSNNKKMKSAIELYDRRIQKFKARTTVKELINSPPCQHDFPPGFSVFRVEIQGECNTVSLKTLDVLRGRFCEALKQEQLSNMLNFIGVHLEQIRSKETTASCFFAVWRFPSVLVPRLEKAAKSNGNAINIFCKSNRILTVSVDGNELYHEEKVNIVIA